MRCALHSQQLSPVEMRAKPILQVKIPNLLGIFGGLHIFLKFNHRFCPKYKKKIYIKRGRELKLSLALFGFKIHNLAQITLKLWQ